MRRDMLWYVLLLAVPVAFFLHWTHAGPVGTFVAAGVGIVPLAAFMGRATEALAVRLGAHVGGLLNATFGNAAELILGAVALHRGLFIVVKASIIGSIIGNALLVLGLSLLVGGLKYRRQKFNRTAAALQATLLVLAVLGLTIPSVCFGMLGAQAEINLSEEVAAVLLATYVLHLVFSLLTQEKPEEDAVTGPVHVEEASAWKPSVAAGVLLVATTLVAVLSEFLVGALEEAKNGGFLDKLGMSEMFVGVVVVAIIGNAAEHSTAVVMAYRNKVDLTLHIAVGSGLQIALLVVPLLVFGSLWLAPRPMDLHFTLIELLSVGASAIVVALVANDGESNWMEGVLLLAVYAILALAFYHIPAPAG